jgi:Tfp pilus assembly protein PilF
LIKLEERREGLQMLQKALDIEPDNGPAHMGLSRYYADQNNCILAREHLAQANTSGAHPDLQLLQEINSKCP